MWGGGGWGFAYYFQWVGKFFCFLVLCVLGVGQRRILGMFVCLCFWVEGFGIFFF